MTTLTEEQARELAQEYLNAVPSGDETLDNIKDGCAMARYILSRPSPGVQTMADILTPELIKDAADAGERVGWESVLTNGAQIYHREIDLKKYETALRAVLPDIIDRLTSSPAPAPSTQSCPSCGVSIAEYNARGCDGVDGAPDVPFEGCKMLAQAAPTTIPPGWKLVPREPTQEMTRTVCEPMDDRGSVVRIWQAMYDAAPTPGEKP